MSIYQYQANLTDGKTMPLSNYDGQVLLIVNTASECGFTPQYEGLERLYQSHQDDDFAVLGFPCNQFGSQEPGSNQEIQQFCSTNYHISFPLFEKIEVNGENAHPLYSYLKEAAPEETADIKWNFTKFLIDQSGQVVKRYESKVTPAEIEADLKTLL